MTASIIALTLLLKGVASLFAGALGSNRRCGAVIPFLMSLLLSPLLVIPFIAFTSRFKSRPDSYVLLRDKDGNTIPMLDRDGKQQKDLATGKPLWMARQKTPDYFRDRERSMLKAVFITPVWSLLKYTVFSPLMLVSFIRESIVEHREQGTARKEELGEELKPGDKLPERVVNLYDGMLEGEKYVRKEDAVIEEEQEQNLSRSERKSIDALLEISDKLGLCFREKASLQRLTDMVRSGKVSDAVGAVGAEAAAQGLTVDQCSQAIEGCEGKSFFRDVRFTDSFFSGYVNHRSDMLRQETPLEGEKRELSEEEVLCNKVKDYLVRSREDARSRAIEPDSGFMAAMGGYFCGVTGIDSKVMQRALRDAGVSQEDIDGIAAEHYGTGVRDSMELEEKLLEKNKLEVSRSTSPSMKL